MATLDSMSRDTVTKRIRVQRLKTVKDGVVPPDPLDDEPKPTPRNPDLPQMFWLAGLCAARGSGKTQFGIRLLKSYEECGIVNEHGKPIDQRIILYSPTFDANPSFKKLKHLAKEDIHETYTEKSLLEEVAGIKADRLATQKYKKAVKLWKDFMALRNRDLDPLVRMRREDLELLSSQTNGFRQPPVPPPHPLGQVCFLVLDDCLGSAAFSLQRLNKFTQFAMNSRHFWCCIMILSQRAKQIPPAIRTNLSLLCHWRLMSRKVLLEEVWPLCSELLSESDFLALYEVATEGKHDCLTIDSNAPPGRQFRKNMSECLSFA